jgi:type I pantothenate kinase
VNLVNLHENIVPTRGRANLLLEKDGNHSVQRVRMRKL